MEAMGKLMAHMRQRPFELKKLKEKGSKIVGYVPNGYMPEELVCASGAIPVGLIRGGDREPVIASEAYLLRFLDIFCRSQIGYRVLKQELLYQLPDLVIVPITDRNISAIAESWQLFTDVSVFKLGVPRYNQAEHAFNYYIEGLNLLKQRLEKFTGMRIQDERLREEIDLSNRIRSLLEEISHRRKLLHPPISGKDFIRLNHATYYADRKILVETLESIIKEFKKCKAHKPRGPRIMLTGSTMAEGDYEIIDLLEEMGAVVVIEEFSEGVRHYQQKVVLDGDPINALADRYLRRRIPPAFFRGATKERFNYLLKLIREFKVDGVLWYSLMYRDSYDREGLLFSKVLAEQAGIPFLKISSSYDVTQTGPERTRIEAFIEIIEGRGGKWILDS